MRHFLTVAAVCLPGVVWAAAGGVGDGFGADDWIAKWPVLAIVVLCVAGMTTFLSLKIFKRAKRDEGAS